MILPGAGGSGCGGGILLRGGVVTVTGTLDASGGPGGTIKFFAGTGLSTNGATLSQGRLSTATGIPTISAAVDRDGVGGLADAPRRVCVPDARLCALHIGKMKTRQLNDGSMEGKAVLPWPSTRSRWC